MSTDWGVDLLYDSSPNIVSVVFVHVVMLCSPIQPESSFFQSRFLSLFPSHRPPYDQCSPSMNELMIKGSEVYLAKIFVQASDSAAKRIA